MEIKLTENEKRKLEKVYECIYDLNYNVVDLDDYLRDVGWPFDGISPENYRSETHFSPTKIFGNFEDLPFTSKMSLLGLLI